MFNHDFWPTPPEIAQRMIDLVDPSGKTILEPSAGMGSIVIQLKKSGAKVIACENEERLRRVLEHECEVIEDDFFQLTSERISHIHAIIMNPPFRNADRHIQHAWDICPSGCKIVALCNTSLIENKYSSTRKILNTIIDDYGYSEDWGKCFSTAERETEINVSMIYLRKPGNEQEEYSEFFLDEEPDDQGIEGIMQYDAIRDIVNRYVAAVKLYDEQIQVGIKMRALIDIFPTYNDINGKEQKMKYISCNPEKVSEYKSDFKKGLQKRAWKFIFDKLDMHKHSTRGLKEDINKFVEQQCNIPFTMKNIYRMLEIVIGTTGSRMDKAMLEVFDKLTKHYDENRYHVEGWKTNSDYLVNQKFIINNICSAMAGAGKINFDFYRNGELLEDLSKALCYMTGKRYEDTMTLQDTCRGYKYNRGEYKEEHTNTPPVYGELFDWEFFQVRAYKKGTMHFKFKDENVWYQFNKNIARIKGYPLFEHNKKRNEFTSSYQTEM